MKLGRLLVFLALAAFAVSSIPTGALAAPGVARVGPPTHGRGRRHKKAKRVRKKRRRSARSQKGLEF